VWSQEQPRAAQHVSVGDCLILVEEVVRYRDSERGRVKKVLRVFLGLLIVGLCGFGAWVAITSVGLPDVANLRASISSELAARGSAYVPLDRVPPGQLSSLVAVEDKRFYEHHGIDWIRVGGALWANAKARHVVQGASTITEQLVDNTLLRDEEKGLARKVRAILLSRRVEQAYTKDQILELYLNAIYYGPGSYGIEAASGNYFGRLPSDLDQEQQLFLAGVIRGPALYDPYWYCPAARRRIDEVIAARLEASSLSRTEAEALRAAPLVYTHGVCQAQD
jgi:membrane peptidoglycan carboxypeptidase